MIMRLNSPTRLAAQTKERLKIVSRTNVGLHMRRTKLINKKRLYNNVFFKEWFLIQRELTTLFREISPKELNECLQKFYLSVRKRDGRWVFARQNSPRKQDE